MRKLFWILALLLMFCQPSITAIPVQAQTSSQKQSIPLIIKETQDNNPSGHLWAWYSDETPLKKLTTWPHNNQPFMSPDGRWAAYTALSQSFIDYQGVDFGAVPMDMWLLDLTTGKAEIIAGQPAGNVFDDKGQFAAYTIRSDFPTWSPDGKMLAWDEQVLDFRATATTQGNESNYHHLIVYDVQKKQARAVARILNEGRGSANPIWGNTGIAVPFYSATAPSTQIFSSTGKLLFNLSGYPIPPCWVEDDIHEYLSTVQHDNDPNTNNESLVLLDLKSGKYVDYPETLELYNRAAPAGLILRETGTPYVAFTRQIIVPGKASVDLPKSRYIAISPDGQQVAYQTDSDQLYVYNNGKATRIETNFRIEGLTWGTMIYRIPNN